MDEDEDAAIWSLIEDPNYRETAKNLLVGHVARTYHPAFVLDICDLAAAYLRNARLTEDSWRGIAPDAIEAMSDYLTRGPNDRIPDDDTALRLMLAIVELAQFGATSEAGRVSPFNPGLEGKA